MTVQELIERESLAFAGAMGASIEAEEFASRCVVAALVEARAYIRTARGCDCMDTVCDYFGLPEHY